MKLKPTITRRFVTIAVIAAVVCISSQIGYAAASPVISVEPTYMDVWQDDEFTVNIAVDPAENEVYGASYTLHFNNTLLMVTSWTQGEFLTRDGNSSNVWIHEIDNPIGKFEYAEGRMDTDVGVGGDPGNLTTITFQVIGAEGVGLLNISDLDGELLCSASGSIPTTVYNGRAGIAQTQSPFVISGYVSYENGSGCDDSFVNITNLYLGVEWTAETTETSNYYQLTLASPGDVIAGDVLRFEVVCGDGSNVTEHTVTQTEVDVGGFGYGIVLDVEAIPGDVNGDGEVTSADAVIALKMAVCGEYDLVADVNKDHVVTSLDALMIMQAADGGTINIALGCR